MQVILAVNGFFFPLGLFILGLLIWPVRRGLRQGRGEPVAGPAGGSGPWPWGGSRPRICVACWLAAAVVWPTVLLVEGRPPAAGDRAVSSTSWRRSSSAG